MCSPGRCSNLLGSAVWAVDSRVHCSCSRGRQHPGSCGGVLGSQHPPVPFHRSYCFSRYSFKRTFIQQSSQAGLQLLGSGPGVCTDPPGWDGRSWETLWRAHTACCQHECAICPLCTAVEHLHVPQPHLQVHCRHILRMITGGHMAVCT